MMLDLDACSTECGSLLFFKNGKRHGPGYPPGSITVPCRIAILLFFGDEKCQQGGRLLHETKDLSIQQVPS
jgi:hypothetical protein